MKKIYLKLIGLVTFNISNGMHTISRKCNTNQKEVCIKKEFNRAYIDEKHIGNENQTYVNVCKKNVCKTKEEEKKSVLFQETAPVINFFEIMNISIKLDYNNYEGYTSTLDSYNKYVYNNYDNKYGYIPILTKEGYETSIIKLKEFNDKNNKSISIKNKENYLTIDVRSNLVDMIIKNKTNQDNEHVLKTLAKKIKSKEEIYVTKDDIYTDIFFANKIFSSFKENLIDDSMKLYEKEHNDFIKDMLEPLIDLCNFLKNKNIYVACNKKDKKKAVLEQSLDNFLKVMNYFNKGINQIIVTNKNFTFENLEKNPSQYFNKISDVNQIKEVVFLFKTLIKSSFTFNQDRFIVPGITELLLFKKSIDNVKMDFQKLDNFLMKYWNELVPLFKKIEEEIITKKGSQSFVEELLLKLKKNENFNNKFNELVKNFILGKNKEIIMDSKEMLLHVNFTNEVNIFFINSDFIKNLMNIHKKIKINDEITELMHLMGHKKENVSDLEDIFVTNCLKGAFISDMAFLKINEIIKLGNKKFIEYLKKLEEKINNKSISHEKLKNSINEILKLNKDINGGDNVSSIVGLEVAEKNTYDTIAIKSIGYDGSINKQINLDQKDSENIYEHRQDEKIKNFVSDIFKTLN